MDVINFRPGDVRGGGNIISPSKTLSDFDVSDSVLTTVSDTVDGKTVSVYNVAYRSGSYFTVTDVTYGTGSVSVELLLTNKVGTAITSASVSCIVNNETSLSGTTNSSGKVTFTVTDDDGYYSLRTVYAGTNSVAGCSQHLHLYIGDLEELKLFLEKVFVPVGDTVLLIANIDKQTSGHSVSFYKE